MHPEKRVVRRRTTRRHELNLAELLARPSPCELVGNRWFVAGLRWTIWFPMSTEPSTPTPEPEGPQAPGLVVERKTGESVVIGDDVEIKLLGMKGDQARIGVLVPEGVTVVRSEARRATSRDS
jgi:carbon storage regulator CsrA